MTVWAELASASNCAGDEIILRNKGELYEIRFNGMELMSSFNHRSERILAERTLLLLGRPARKVLIGGLGLGFTLRAALDRLGARAAVTVCEIVPEIVEWNRHHLGHLAGHPLRDPRVEIRVGDVMTMLNDAREDYDVVLMDTDNGPDFLVRATNGDLYEDCGLRAVWRSLDPAGVAAFWSATISPEFEKRLGALQWNWRRDDIGLVEGRPDAVHHIYVATRHEADPARPGALADVAYLTAAE